MKTNQITLEYSINPYPRYGYSKPPHEKIYRIIDRKRNDYKDLLKRFLFFKKDFLSIPVRTPTTSTEPCWINGMQPGLDSVSLYTLLCLNNPKRYFEIGSGYSTKFVRRAISHQNLRTKITSIDPYPRT